jgi:hypothetical protein
MQANIVTNVSEEPAGYIFREKGTYLVEEPFASRQRRKHEIRKISVVRNRNRATTSEYYNRLRLSMCYSDLLSVHIAIVL